MGEEAQRRSRHEQACSIARAVEVIGDRWTILVLRDAFKGIRRFEDLRRDLDIARPVLADRLKRLVDHGVLEKRLYQERPQRYEYRLTPMGRELSPILVALMRWGDHHLAGDAGPPTVLTHECGHELRQGFYCPACREVFSPGEIRSRPGPGALPGAPRAGARPEPGAVAPGDVPRRPPERTGGAGPTDEADDELPTDGELPTDDELPTNGATRARAG